MLKNYSRRDFILQNLMVGAGLGLTAMVPHRPRKDDLPAILGGPKAHAGDRSRWAIWKPETDEARVLDVLRSGKWSRANVVADFETQWAELIGSKRCLTLVNGTNSLFVSLLQLGIGGGDEVILPPYTFIACPQAILATGAIPVFADIDKATYQIDPKKLEAKITPRTKAILPVHILGFPCDMVSIMKIAKKHNLVVVEDACQAWLAEIDHKKVGTFGDAGCFSFQNSKNIPMGEGGAIVSDNDEFMDRCYSYHNYGLAYGSVKPEPGGSFVMSGTKLRLTEYQAAIGLSQLVRFQDQTDLREQNAAYLKSLLENIPGIITYSVYENVTKSVFHLFPFRYDQEQFKGLPRSEFLKALRAVGVPCSSGYVPLNKMPYLEHAFKTKNFQKMYSAEELDIQKYNENNSCPLNDELCEEAVWLSQNMLLGNRTDMENIAHAIQKIHKNADKIKKKSA